MKRQIIVTYWFFEEEHVKVELFPEKAAMISKKNKKETFLN